MTITILSWDYTLGNSSSYRRMSAYFRIVTQGHHGSFVGRYIICPPGRLISLFHPSIYLTLPSTSFQQLLLFQTHFKRIVTPSDRFNVVH